MSPNFPSSHPDQEPRIPPEPRIHPKPHPINDPPPYDPDPSTWNPNDDPQTE